jgi:hypothetical protein
MKETLLVHLETAPASGCEELDQENKRRVFFLLFANGSGSTKVKLAAKLGEDRVRYYSTDTGAKKDGDIHKEADFTLIVDDSYTKSGVGEIVCIFEVALYNESMAALVWGVHKSFEAKIPVTIALKINVRTFSKTLYSSCRL